MSKLETFVGIDVAQETLEIAVRPTGEVGRWLMMRLPSATLVDRLRELGPSLIVLEATGESNCRWWEPSLLPDCR